jgi:hypothetical protein
MYLSDLGSNPLIIDDGNATKFIDQWRQEGYSFGMTPRDYAAAPFGSASRPLYQYQYESDRNKLRDRIKRADDNKATPDDWRIAGEVDVLDQDQWGYCWFYATVGAMLTAYSMTGIKVPKLNPFPTAYRGKNGRNQGGWGEEALRYIDQFGVVEASLWPGHEAKMSNWDRQEVKENAALHKVTQSLELPQKNILALISVLTDPKWPRPVVLGLSWWGHEVYGVRALAMEGGKFGVKFVNSWKYTWGEQGCGILTESKAAADEQIAIQRALPIKAAE